jgi:hypothetical protein
VPGCFPHVILRQ